MELIYFNLIFIRFLKYVKHMHIKQTTYKLEIINDYNSNKYLK
jgi:hypothetical protein